MRTYIFLQLLLLFYPLNDSAQGSIIYSNNSAGGSIILPNKHLFTVLVPSVSLAANPTFSPIYFPPTTRRPTYFPSFRPSLKSLMLRPIDKK